MGNNGAAASDVMMCTFFHITFRTSTAEALIHACSCGNIAAAPVLLHSVNVSQNLEYAVWHVERIRTKSRSSSLLVYSRLYLPSGFAVLGESSWSEGDSEVLEPGEEDMLSCRDLSRFFYILFVFWPCYCLCLSFCQQKTLYTQNAPFHVVITSYQLVVQDVKYFQRVKWQYMVLDEAQALKSSTRYNTDVTSVSLRENMSSVAKGDAWKASACPL